MLGKHCPTALHFQPSYVSVYDGVSRRRLNISILTQMDMVGTEGMLCL